MTEEHGADCSGMSVGEADAKGGEYRLKSPILHAAASVPAGITESHTRRTRKDDAHFVSIARRSLAETEAVRFSTLLKLEPVEPVLAHCTEIGKMPTVLLDRLYEPPPALVP